MRTELIYIYDRLKKEFPGIKGYGIGKTREIVFPNENVAVMYFGEVVRRGVATPTLVFRQKGLNQRIKGLWVEVELSDDPRIAPRVMEQHVFSNVYPVAKRIAELPSAVAEAGLSASGVVSFLKTVRTRFGQLRNVYWDAGERVFFADPSNRQRLDHYGNGGEGWDEEAWEDEYASPLREEVQALLDRKYPGKFSVEVDEKGGLEISVEPGAKVASATRVVKLAQSLD